MVAGHLQEKKGLFYIVLSYTDVENKRRVKWIPTNLPVKGNKKRAEQMLWDERNKFKPPVEKGSFSSDMLFADYLEDWVKVGQEHNSGCNVLLIFLNAQICYFAIFPENGNRIGRP